MRRLARAWLCSVIAATTALAAPVPGLSERDRETLALEARVADDPRAALKEAGAWFEQARKAGDKAGELKAMRLKVLALYQVEDTHRMLEAADAAMPLARELGDVQAECEFLLVKGGKLSSEGKFKEARALYEQAAELASRHGLARTAATIDVANAFDLSILGRDAEAIKLLSEAHQRFVDLGDAAGARNALAAIGNAYIHEHASADDLRKAASFYERAIPPGAEKTRRHELATSYVNLGAVYHRLKDFAKARDYLDRGIALYATLGDVIGQGYGGYRLGLVFADEGKWREALARQDKALASYQITGDTTMRFNAHRARARALAELDRRRESLDALQAAEALAAASESSWVKHTYLADAAQVYARNGEFDRAFKTMVALREVEQAESQQARARDEKEIKTRFEVNLKDAENELLRARAQEAEARRLVLILTIALLALVLGGLGWVLVRQGQQSRRFASLALRDDLTALPNRRAIVEFALEQMRQAALNRQKLVIALIDIDHFKSINDRHGHAVGDRVLAAFAALCQQQLRSNDRIGRYGGEEFMLVMPGSDASQVSQVFTRLRLAMRNLRAEGYSADEQITFSLGAAEFKGTHESLDSVIRRADEALYRAKQGGRDRNEIA